MSREDVDLIMKLVCTLAFYQDVCLYGELISGLFCSLFLNVGGFSSFIFCQCYNYSVEVYK